MHLPNKIGPIVTIIGVILIIASFSVPAFSILSVEPNGTSSGVTLTSVVPASTSSSSPTLLQYSATTESVSATWSISISVTNSYTDGASSYSPASDSGLIAFGQTGGSSSTTTVTPTTNLMISSALEGSGSYLNLLSGTLTVSTSIPMDLNITYSFYFNFTATVYLSSTEYQIYGGTPIHYGQMQATMLNNGHFYTLVGGNYQEITPTSNILLYPTALPYVIPFWYVEDNGTPQNQGTVFLLNAGSKITFNLQATPQTINGHDAWEANVTITAQGTYTINGYVTNSITNANVQLMSIGFSDKTTGSGGNGNNTPAYNQSILGAGIVVMIVGVIALWRKW